MATLTPEQQQEFARRRLQIQSDAEINKRRLGEDYDISQRLLTERGQRDQYDMGNAVAANGLFNSGIRIDAQGRIQNDLNNTLSSLGLDRARGLEDIQRGITTGLADVDFAQSEALAYATRQEALLEQQRALLEAQRRAAVVPAIQYPNPVITYNQPQIPLPPQLTGGGQSASSNLSAFLNSLSGGATKSIGSPVGNYLQGAGSKTAQQFSKNYKPKTFTTLGKTYG